MNKLKTRKVWERMVSEERKSQDEKWGEQNHIRQVWIAILGEEFGELCTEINNYNPGYSSSRIEKELIQIAAVCQVMWECGVRNGWLLPPLGEEGMLE